jgi:tetratricopeptide (TPR) repeat protein
MMMVRFQHARGRLVVAIVALGVQAVAPGAMAEDIVPDAPAPSLTPEQRLDQLFADLASSEGGDAEVIQRRIGEVWSRSGSDSMDYLLTRGREAMEAEEYDKAVDHLTALVELEPDFAEGWNARATAYYLQDDYWSSVADIQKVLELEPRHFGALSGLAIMLERVEADAAALAAYRATLEVNPHMESVAEAIERLAPIVDGLEL